MYFGAYVPEPSPPDPTVARLESLIERVKTLSYMPVPGHELVAFPGMGRHCWACDGDHLAAALAAARNNSEVPELLHLAERLLKLPTRGGAIFDDADADLAILKWICRSPYDNKKSSVAYGDDIRYGRSMIEHALRAAALQQ